ncbi:Sodium-dependent neutral amino acid transporter B(0)AT2 [Larimichthys crocea]|uniref:Transporter n=1 Tax=Larimichthys crocea TaxID=215358 RepID=A0A6G0HVL8_LARCR|nr:Sodium-dependent neutral amino acid transporter B(0)AT2 [Larimichthys crocea]
MIEKPPLDSNGEEDRAWLSEGQSETQLTTVHNPDGVETPDEDRPAWDSKIQYVLAQVGFSVGLGNVWRFPYLCHQNGGGAFMLLYVFLLLIVGVPLFFMELAAGQSIRQGSIGVWKHISPKLAGIGYSSCMVCFYVALYYNVIIAWSLFYLGNSFQYPLPWEHCPIDVATNNTVKECADSSPTSYFWFRKALQITNSIEESGEFNPIMTGCLLAAWAIVSLAMIKGIKSSAKVMYFSSVFPYVVLFIFLIRGLMLDGAMDGITYMFYPKLEIWGSVQVWRQAATQVFFALGLGYGSVIAYSSYNPSIALRCVAKNLGLLNLMTSDDLLHPGFPWINTTNPDSVSITEYREWYSHYSSMVGPNITDCSLEEEMNKGVEGTGLAFIAFTECASCVLGFLLGLLFTQCSGNYFVAMFDDYSATLPLVIVVIFETISVAWVYGTDRFLDDIEVMLKWRPPVIYKYLWKYVCLLAMVGLMLASLLRMVLKGPTYTAWNQNTASEMTLEYPGWALAMIVMLIVFASLPVPIGYIHSMLKNRRVLNTHSEEVRCQELHRELYTKCSSNEQLDSNSHHLVPSEEDEARPRTAFLPLGNEHYRLLPQQEEEDEEDTGV